MSDRCEWTRDRLPDLVAGALGADEAAALHAHAAGCEACAREMELIQALHADVVAVPAQLEWRIRTALRQDVQGSRRWLTPGRLAIAATVVFALVTARFVTGPNAEPMPDGSAPVATTEGGTLAPPGWPLADVPLLRDGPALYQLSVEELETLLREMES